MRVAIVAPPFIPVPPVKYGGTELFVAQLAEGLSSRGHDVVVYTNGESRVRCDRRWLYPQADWPPTNGEASARKNLRHSSWAIGDAARSADILHLNDVVGLPFTSHLDLPRVLTMHHPHEPALSAIYQQFPETTYVAISNAQARREPMDRVRVVHHGLRIDDYRFATVKDDYVAFLGRMVPCKGAHTAINVARRAGLRLKLAGEVQPMFEDYWREVVLPQVDGDRIQYIGEADGAMKNELLSGARALLFPIDWEEPFGLVMVEAMACGTPVLAFGGGSVPEIVRDGVSGWICADVDEMIARAVSPGIPAGPCRSWAKERFSCERMVDGYLNLYDRLRTGDRQPAAVEGNVSWTM
ncbi:MAG TPA: glycosyltransferase family 4 protein [Vicinamibacterales bacterium]|nr:glycosyltransferase family 4 protein [Vicinamibacterales bacterium]